MKYIPFSIQYYVMKCCLSGPKSKRQILDYCNLYMTQEITVAALTQTVSDLLINGIVCYKSNGPRTETTLQNTVLGRETLDTMFNRVLNETNFIKEHRK